MDYQVQPDVWFTGNDKYPPQFGKKVCIDWSKSTIRMSLIVYPSHNHPNIKKQVQTQVAWLHLADSMLDFDH